MKFILEKKISGALLGFLLYLSFCVSSFYFARGELSYALVNMGETYQNALFSNAIAAFFFGGIVPFLFYLIMTSFCFRMFYRRLGECALSMRYSLGYFYIAANLLVGLLSLLYLISPLISIYGGVLFPFLSAAIFFAFYLRFVLKHYVKKYMWGSVALTMIGLFSLAYTFITVASMGVI